ncbi:hypothetical protein MNBD_PLANCTO03-2276, partial [hydrothermal vent metagenome]
MPSHLAKLFSAFCLAVMLFGLPGCDQSEDQPSWRESMQRFEERLDETFGELTWTEQDHAPLVGIFLPADETPLAAR